ncbi:unnamed protein product, partial [Phaeothamnion confervicola]
EGAFAVHGVLSKRERESVIAVAERMGFLVYDAGKNTHGALTWLLDAAHAEELFRRCLPFLPQLPLRPGKNQPLMAPVGINRRCRLYRYQPNGVDDGYADGDASVMRWDAYGDGRRSLLTFLLYLNDDFSGGATTF